MTGGPQEPQRANWRTWENQVWRYLNSQQVTGWETSRHCHQTLCLLLRLRSSPVCQSPGHPKRGQRGGSLLSPSNLGNCPLLAFSFLCKAIPLHRAYQPFLFSILVLSWFIALFLWPSNYCQTWSWWVRLQRHYYCQILFPSLSGSLSLFKP